jgi:predicted O-linked N-acetylglucosamine transferase (SPINDLY family)
MQTIISEDGLKEVNMLMAKTIGLYKAGQYDNALQILLPLVEKYPNIAEPLHFISIVYTQMNDYTTALSYMDKSIMCPNGQTDKNFFNKGVCLFKLDKHTEAINAFETVIKINPDHMEAYENIVRISKDSDQVQKYGKACIKKGSKCPDVYVRVGTMRDPFHYYYDNIEVYLKYFKLKVSDEDYTILETLDFDSEIFNKTLLRCAIAVGQPKIGLDLLLCTPSIYHSEGQIDDLRDRFSRNIDFLMENLPDNFFPSVAHLVSVINHSSFSFYLSYQNRSNSKLFAKLCALYRRKCKDINYIAPHCHKLVKTQQKIKVAFLSNFLSKNHSVCRDRMGIIERLPRDIFDVYYIIYEKPQSVLGVKLWNSNTQKLIIPQNDIKKSTQMIEDLKLDILVYCEIAMDPIAYYLSFKRLAPIQCNTWGHSDTSGIDTIDYYMSSKYFELDNLDEAQEHYSEKLLPMESLCTYYYNPANFIPKDQEYLTRYELGISTNVKMYVCIQSTYKLYPTFDKIINEILVKDPKAQLFLLEQFSLKPQWMSRMEKVVGHNMNRIHILGRQEFVRYMSYLKEADAIIDPYPFGGCNSSFEAFSLGQAVVTMPGDFINGRFTHGFYKKMGILDMVANTTNEYVELAIRCANDTEWKREVCERILEKQSLLFEEDNSVKTWTQALLNIYIKKLKEDESKPDTPPTTVEDSTSISDVTEMISDNTQSTLIDLLPEAKSVTFEVTDENIVYNKTLSRFTKSKDNVFWSVIMPMHNREKYIKQAIQSVLVQAPIKGNMELILLDDKSSLYVPVRDIVDNILSSVSKKVKKNILRTIQFKYEYHTENLGEFANTNYGINKSNGKWVHILHDDDWMSANFYNTFHDNLQDKENIGFACCQFNNTDMNGKITWESPKLQEMGELVNFVERVAIANPLHLHAVAFKREIFDEIGLFRDDIRFYADWELYRRTYKSTNKWYYIPGVFANYRIHDKTESAQRDTTLGTYKNSFWSAIDAANYLPVEWIKTAREFHSKRYLEMANAKYSQNKHIEAIHLIEDVLANNNINNSDTINNTIRDHCQKLKIGFVEHIHVPKISIKDFDPLARKQGISGFMKIRNEEEYLGLVLDSWVPHLDELVIVYNQCTDRTPEIVQEYATKYLGKIKAFHYIPEVHRIGTKEHAETDVNSVNNFAHYVNFALSKTTYKMCVLVDGDDIAIPENLEKVTTYIKSNQIENECLIYSGINLYNDQNNNLFVSENNLFAGDGDHTFFTVSPINRYFKTDRWEFLNKANLKATYLGFLYYHAKYLKNDHGFGNSGTNDEELNKLIQHQTFNIKEFELSKLLDSDMGNTWLSNIPKHSIHFGLNNMPNIKVTDDILNNIDRNISCNISKIDEENKTIKISELVYRTDNDIIKHNTFVFDNYQLDKKFILNFPCWHKQSNNDMNLIIQYYIPSDQNRLLELNKCLFNNLQNDAFTKIHIFTEKLIDFNNVFQQFPNIEKYTYQIDNWNSRIIQTVISSRLSYQHVFEYVNTHLVDQTCVLANTDIYFDNSIKFVYDINLTNIVFALTRYDVDVDGYSTLYTHSGAFGNPCIDSQDVWIFKGSIEIADNCDFELGQWGCDNSIASVFYKAGLEVLNPCKTIKAYHLDLTETRAHNEDHKIHEQYMYLLQCELKTETTIELELSDSNDLTIYKYKDNFVKWQTPVITEEHSYNLIKNSNLKCTYLAIPWATLLDKYTDRSKDGVFPDIQYNNLNLIKDLHFLELQNGITVCQHIYFEKLIPLFKKIGITTIFTPHVDKTKTYTGINVLPYPLFPVNSFLPDTKGFTDNCNLLYSFVGSYSDSYISDIRNKIFEMSHPENTYIVKRDSWHFENNVYQNQIFNLQRTSENISIDKEKEDEYTKILSQSRYTLCPSGTGVNSIRFWEALCSGSIPVLLSDNLILPSLSGYNLSYDWSDSIVRIAEKDIHKLTEILINITDDDVIIMRNRCLELGELFSKDNFINPIKQYIQNNNTVNNGSNNIQNNNTVNNGSNNIQNNNTVNNDSNNMQIVSYCCDKYPNSFGGVPRFDYQLSLIYPDRLWFGPKQKQELLSYLKINNNIIVITDNHLVCDIPNEYPTIVVHHGCARTHADRDPYWNETIKNYIVNGQDNIFKYRNPNNTWFVSISQFCSDEFQQFYKEKYTQFTRHNIINASELDEDNYKQEINNSESYKPVIIGNWTDYNKGSKIIQKLARKLKNEFVFKNIHIPNMTDINEHNRLKSEFYKEADIYLCLSLSEGSSYALLDSMITNLLLIGTNVGLMYKDVPSDVGRVVNWERRDDVDYLVDIIRDVWSKRNSLFNKTREWYLNNNSFNKWKTEFTNIVNLFQQKVINNNSSNGVGVSGDIYPTEIINDIQSKKIINTFDKKRVFFYIDPLGESANSANYQHPLISLGEGLQKYSIPFSANVNYWKIDGEYLFKKADFRLEDISQYDIVVTKFSDSLPNFFSKKYNTIQTVMIDWSDGLNTYSNKYQDIFDIYYKCSYNTNLNQHKNHIYPCAFQITDRFIDHIKPNKWKNRQKHIVISHRVKHPVRDFFYENFYKRSQVPVFIMNDDFKNPLTSDKDDSTADFKNPLTSDKDDSTAIVSDNNVDSLWYQSGRRHNMKYFDVLSNSQICDCTGGFFVQDQHKKVSVFQWDSLKIWEAFVSGCVVITIDLEYYGCKLPIMPKNGVHYIGLRNDQLQLDNLIRQLNNNELDLEKIAMEGRKWALDNYSSVAFADRFLSIVNNNNSNYTKVYGQHQKQFSRQVPNCIKDMQYVLDNHNKNHTVIDWNNLTNYNGIQEYVCTINNVLIMNDGNIYHNSNIVFNPNNNSIPINKNNNIVHCDKLINIVQQWGYGYYHWINEQLPKIIQVQKYMANNNLDISEYKFLIYKTPFIIESLKYIGINEKQIMPFNNSNTYTVKQCIYSNNIRGGNPAYENIFNIRESYNINNNAGDIDEDSKCCIIIKRNGLRKIKNFNVLFNQLKRSYPNKNWVVYENMDFNETVKLFSRAELIIGAHGAGLSNIVFSPLNTHIIELVSDTDPNVCYWHLSNILNNNYWMVPINYKQDCIEFNAPIDDIILTINNTNIMKKSNIMLDIVLEELYDYFNNKNNIVPKLSKSFLRAYDNTKMYYTNPLGGPHRFIEFPVLLEKIKNLDGDILEIGAHKGECTRLLLDFAEKYNKKVYVIDPWCGDQQGDEDIYQNYFIPNTKDFDNLVVCREKSNSKIARAFMKNLNICFSFIDGLHTYEALDIDIKNAKQCHTNGGIIVVDDVRGVDKRNAEILMNCVESNIINDGWIHKKSPDDYLHTFLIK